jgi:hypothetical protein
MRAAVSWGLSHTLGGNVEVLTFVLSHRRGQRQSCTDVDKPTRQYEFPIGGVADLVGTGLACHEFGAIDLQSSALNNW